MRGRFSARIRASSRRSEGEGATGTARTGHPFEGQSEEQIKATIAAALRGAFDSGASAERARVAEILQAPGAEELPQLAMFLVLGDATAVQATSILAKVD
jgi:hypothetical protein